MIVWYLDTVVSSRLNELSDLKSDPSFSDVGCNNDQKQ